MVAGMRPRSPFGGMLGRLMPAVSADAIPSGRPLELPGRGSTCVIDVPGPPGAPTLILLHALGCTAALSWFPSIAELSKSYRVVTFDQRWHGRGIRSPEFRLDDCADDVAAVADALGIDKFIPVGYSMGGAVAQLVWRRHRERVEGLVLAATARNFRGKPTERLWFMITKVAMTRFGGYAHERVSRLHATLSSEPEALDEARFARWARKEFRSTSAWAMFAVVDEIGRFDSSAWIGQVRVPTSVVVAANDKFIPTRRQHRLAASIPLAMSYEFPGSHAGMVIGAERFVPELVNACNSVARRIEEQRRLAG